MNDEIRTVLSPASFRASPEAVKHYGAGMLQRIAGGCGCRGDDLLTARVVPWTPKFCGVIGGYHVSLGDDGGTVIGPVRDMMVTEWKPAPTHIEYEESDAIWGHYFGFAEERPLQAGDKFCISRFIDGLTGEVVVTNHRIESDPEQGRILSTLDFVPLEGQA